MGLTSSFQSEVPAIVSVFQLVLTVQFGVSFTIFILATLGISFGYSVASYYLLALLQVILAVPGIVYLATQASVMLAVYVAFQLVMIISEIYWLAYVLVDSSSGAKWVALVLLTILQIVAVVVAMFYRETKIPFKWGKKGKTMASENPPTKKLDMKNASSSICEDEISKSKRNTKSNSKTLSNSEKSKKSKKSMKSKLAQKMKKVAAPTDSFSE